MNYLQIVSIIGQLPVDWPGSVEGTTEATQNAVVAMDIFNTECFYSRVDDFSSIPRPFLRLLIFNILPFVLAILAVLFWLIVFFIKKQKKDKTLLRYIMTTITIIWFNMQPKLIRKNFKLLECKNLYREDTPLEFLTADYDVRCWSSTHLTWFYALALPALIF